MKRIIIALVLLCLFALPLKAEILPGQFVSWSDFSHITCVAIAQDFAYFGTTEGILRYNRFEHAWYPPITPSDGLPDAYVNRMAVSPDGLVIYVDLTNGVYSYDLDLKRWSPEVDFPDQYYLSSQPPKSMPRFFMPFGFTMYPEGYITDNYLRDFKITAYQDDQFSTIFVGTWGLGPALVDNRDYQTTIVPYGLLQKRTDALYLDGDSLWLAGNEGLRSAADFESRLGVTLFEKSKQNFTWLEPRYISGFDSEIIYDITGDQKRIYFAGQLGVTILTRKDGSYLTLNHGDGLPNNEATALAVRNDSLWIGTTNGLALYTPSVDTITVINRKMFENLFITDLLLVGNKLIIGSNHGAFYIDLDSKEVGRLKDPQDDLGGEIRSLSVHNNELLISTDYGVTSINLLTERAKALPYVNGPPGAYAAVATDKLYLVSTNDGLMIITKDGYRRHLLTEDDGLLSTTISVFLLDERYLWIGSEEGLTRFDINNPRRID